MTNDVRRDGFGTLLKRQVDDVRNDVVDAIEDAASGAGFNLGKYAESFSAAPIWIVNHNLGRPVTVRVSGIGGREVVAEVVYVTDNQARVFFDVPTPGSVSVT